MRRRNRVGSRFVVGVVVVIVLCILSALYSGVTGNPSPVTRLVSFVTTPVQRLASGVTGALGKGFGYFTEFDELKAENEELKKQIRDMEQTVRDAELAIEENNQLRAAAGQPERTRELTTINAEVIARNPGDWAMTLSLDKGSSHGVEEGDLVTTVDGMVGYVSEVYSNNCEVTTVIDVEMQCGALITRTRETAIAEGNYDLMADGNLRLSYLTEDSSVVIGDTVETSGRGGLFPKGVMIGTVESVLPEENGISYYAVIKPFVNVDTVSSVSIVTDFTDTTE
nr:rod shape-determining protein MreC [uncultured Agathobaculum sp.]